MAIDFPSTPTIGQKYPDPAVAGQVQYTWDGEKWTSYASPGEASDPIIIFSADSGLQLNGGMEISQENNFAVGEVVTGTIHPVDGFKIEKPTGTSRLSAQGVVTNIPGFARSLKLICLVAQPTIGSDVTDIALNVEGILSARLGWGTPNAIPMTMSFWIKSSISGSFPVIVYNNDHSAGATQTVLNLVANTAKWVTLTYPGQTTGVWDKGNLAGLRIKMRIAAAGSMNFVSTVGNTMEITGVVILPGAQAPTAEQSPFMVRPYNTELQLCKRYYSYCQLSGAATKLSSQTNGSLAVAMNWPVMMRTTPTINMVGGAMRGPADYNCSYWPTGNADLTPSSGDIGVIAPGGIGTIETQAWVCSLSTILDARL